VATACAEAAWLRGDIAAAIEVTLGALDETQRTADGRLAGPLLVWLKRLGAEVPAFEGALHPTFALELDGDIAGAAAAWEAMQIPYERALTLTFGDAEQVRIALGVFEGLGAERAAQIARSRLRALGEAGPRKSTRSDPLGLTVRERKIFELLVDGLSNE